MRLRVTPGMLSNLSSVALAVLVATKTDKLSTNKLKARMNLTRTQLSELGDVSIIPFSAKTGRGREGIWRWIEEVLNG